MKRLLTFLCAVCLTIAVYAQEPLKFWGAEVIGGNIEKMDSAICSHNYKLYKSGSDDCRIYYGEFLNKNSIVFLSINPKENKIRHLIFGVSSDYSFTCSLASRMVRQIEKSHPHFSFIDKSLNGNSIQSYNYGCGSDRIQIDVGPSNMTEGEWELNVCYSNTETPDLEDEDLEGF